MLVSGLMSGTSYDAVDAAAAELRLDGDTLVLEPRGMVSTPYDDGLREALGAALPPKPSGPRLGGRRQWFGQWEATMKRWDVLKQAGMIHIVGYDVKCRGNLFAVTEAGREALAETKEQA